MEGQQVAIQEDMGKGKVDEWDAGGRGLGEEEEERGR